MSQWRNEDIELNYTEGMNATNSAQRSNDDTYDLNVHIYTSLGLIIIDTSL